MKVSHCRFRWKFQISDVLLSGKRHFMCFQILFSLVMSDICIQRHIFGNIFVQRLQTFSLTSRTFLQRFRIARNADRCNSCRCLFVCPFATFRCFVHRIRRYNRRTIILVSGEVKIIRIFAGHQPLAWALKWSDLLSLAKIWAISGHNLETVQDRR